MACLCCTRNFIFLAGLAVVGLRSGASTGKSSGLGAATGLSDGFPWGIWKTFNVMTLTALGSGSFPIGIAAWIFHKRKLHAVMRTTLLISFLVYLIGLLAIGGGCGASLERLEPSFAVLRWNTVSPMWEVLWCMPLYCLFPLFLENTPPILEQAYYFFPPIRGLVVWLVPIIRATYPYVVALAYTLPMMHQSALGGLMLLTGNQVWPLWQTPLLPLLYVWAAAYIGVATTIGAMMLCCLAWKRPIDQSIVDELVKLAEPAWRCPWVGCPFPRHPLPRILPADVHLRVLRSFLFWGEMLLIAYSRVVAAAERSIVRIVIFCS